MTVRSAALLALIGVGLETAVAVWRLIDAALAVARGVAPALMLLTSFIAAFAGVSLVVFLYVVHRTQS